MKTRNNVQKAVLRSGAVIVSFILISFTVSAQDFWKRLLTNSSFNEIAIAMVETSAKKEATDVSTKKSTGVFFFQNEAEPALELEDWMTNSYYFNQSSVLWGDAVVEEPQQLENWMLDENYFNVPEDKEQPLELENWMTSENFWNS